MVLTPEQKAQKKESTLLRIAAHRARQKEYDDALASIDVSALKLAAKKSSEKEDAAIAAKNNETGAIESRINLLNSQIDSLKEKLREVIASHEPVINQTKLDRISAYQSFSTEKQQQEGVINARFELA